MDPSEIWRNYAGAAHCRFVYLDRPKAFHSMEATINLHAARPPANP